MEALPSFLCTLSQDNAILLNLLLKSIEMQIVKVISSSNLRSRNRILRAGEDCSSCPLQLSLFGGEEKEKFNRVMTYPSKKQNQEQTRVADSQVGPHYTLPKVHHLSLLTEHL